MNPRKKNPNKLPQPQSLARLPTFVSGQSGEKGLVQEVYDFVGVEGLRALQSVSKHNRAAVYSYFHSTDWGFSFRPLLFVHFQIEYCYSPKYKVSVAFLELMREMHQAALQNKLDCFLRAATEIPKLDSQGEHKLLSNIARRFFQKNHARLSDQAGACVDLETPMAMQLEYAQRITRSIGSLHGSAKMSVFALRTLLPEDKTLDPSIAIARAQSYLVKAININEALAHLALSDKESGLYNAINFIKIALARLFIYKRNVLRSVGSDDSRFKFLLRFDPIKKKLFDMADELANKIPNLQLKIQVQHEINAKKVADLNMGNAFRVGVNARIVAAADAAQDRAVMSF